MEQRTVGYNDEGPRPYEVAVYWDKSSSFPLRTIALSEGAGHANMGGCFSLCDMLHDDWTEHLRICGCLWLRDLAVEEQARGQSFSADEIYAFWQARSKKGRKKT